MESSQQTVLTIAMEVDRVARSLANITLGSWEEEEAAVKARLDDKSIEEAAERMDAEAEALMDGEVSEPESWSIVPEPPVLEQLIRMAICDRERLKEMPSIKKRRLEIIAAAITGHQSTKAEGTVVAMKDIKNVSWQVKTAEGREWQGPSCVDLPPKWYAACEAVYLYTKGWTDTTWASANLTWDEHRKGPCGGPLCVKGSDIDESTGYLMLFGKNQVHQLNTSSGTARPVRRMESTWGEDGDIIYKTKEEQEQIMVTSNMDHEALKDGSQKQAFFSSDKQ